MHHDDDRISPAVLARATLGGILMGLANLVPGISGGTMLLAAGVYPRFVRAVAAITRLQLRPGPISLLAVVAGAAVAGILLLAGPIKDLVVNQRWIMYSLFIGLTLGGLPVVWRMARPANRAVAFGAAAGFVVMAALAVAQAQGAASAAMGTNPLLLGLGGLAGASAMILPGVSGGYLLLVLGQYVPILRGIEDFETALRARDLGAAMGPALGVMLPVGIGVVVGVVAVSNLLRWLLARYEKATLGVLVGLLLGAVVGLWPFQRPIAPVVGETVVKGRLVTAETAASIDVEDWPTRTFAPSGAQVGGALGLVIAGFLVTTVIARLGREENASSD